VHLVLTLLAAVVPPACARHPPRAPSGLPAPVVATTSCATFTIATDGRVTAAPLPPLPTRRPPPRRFDVARPGPRATAFGLRARLYLARRGEAPRVVGRGVPLGWTRRGTLIALRFRGNRADVDVRDESGRRLRVLARGVGTYAFDGATGTFLYVDGRTIVRSDGRRKTPLAQLPVGRGWWIEPLAGGLVALVAEHRLVVPSIGRFRAAGFIGTPVAGPGGVAFTVTHGYRGYRTRGVEDVELMRTDGSVVHVLRRRMRFALCARGADLEWHGRWLFYRTTEGVAAAVDTATGRSVDLTRFAARLPGYVVGLEGEADLRLAWAGPTSAAAV
jgi:hypothetical protein